MLVWDQSGPADKRHWALYSLAIDPAEQRDVSGDNLAEFLELQALRGQYKTERRYLLTPVDGNPPCA